MQNTPHSPPPYSDTASDLHPVDMGEVSFHCLATDQSFVLEQASSAYAYCYFLKHGSVELEISHPETCTFQLAQGAIVGISGLLPHTLRTSSDVPSMVNTHAGRSANKITHENSHQFLNPLGEQNLGDDGLVIGTGKSEALNFVSAYLGLQIITKDNAPEIHGRMWQALELIETELTHSDPQTHAQSNEVVSHLAQYILINELRFVAEYNSGQAKAVNAITDRRIVRTLLEIGNDPFKNWNVPMLAELANMSRTALSSGFKSLTGETPMAAVRYARLARATYVLETTSEPIEHISEVCGYASANAFVRAFKQVYGISPARWRENALQHAG